MRHLLMTTADHQELRAESKELRVMKVFRYYFYALNSALYALSSALFENDHRQQTADQQEQRAKSIG